ncbi:MAG: iron-sulfur cluster insertion protein ErpA [Alphaproteobacteria bacterium]|nr:iron-sulfur cluster insertion protein ErpA [Alphaproteobacteria bacterium]
MNIVTNPAPISLTDSAVRRIIHLIALEADRDTRLRIGVTGGGCSGFQYVFSLDAKREAVDQVIEHGGAAVVVDDVSLPLVTGLELDWVESLEGSHFAVKNPNATASCSCGSSFAI